MAYTMQRIPPPFSIFVRGLCDLENLLVASSAKSKVQYTSWGGKMSFAGQFSFYMQSLILHFPYGC